MSLDVHTVSFQQGSAAPAKSDRLSIINLYAQANGAGGAGATVTVPVSLPAGVLPASGSYFVDYDMPADYTVFTTAKTAVGFTVNIQPRLAANSVAAGTFNVQITF
jgi:hypothetical protein